MTSTKRKGEKYGFPALLSFLAPGFGQVVKGEVGKGIVIFIMWGIAANCWWLFHTTTIIGLVIAALIFWPQVYDAYETKPNIKKGKTPISNLIDIFSKPILLSIAIGISVLLGILSYFGGMAYIKDIQKKALIKGLDQQQITVDLEYDNCMKSAQDEKYLEHWAYWCKFLQLGSNDCKLPNYYAGLVDEMTKVEKDTCEDIRQVNYDYINSTRNSL